MEEGVVRSEKEESAAFAGCACEASGPRLRMWLMDAMPMRGGGGGRRTSGLRALHLVSVENFLAGFVPFAC